MKNSKTKEGIEQWRSTKLISKMMRAQKAKRKRAWSFARKALKQAKEGMLEMVYYWILMHKFLNFNGAKKSINPFECSLFLIKHSWNQSFRVYPSFCSKGPSKIFVFGENIKWSPWFVQSWKAPNKFLSQIYKGTLIFSLIFLKFNDGSGDGSGRDCEKTRSFWFCT